MARDIKSPAVVRKLFDTLGARFATRPGGYTRILRLGPRPGDGAEMAFLELVGYEYKPPGKKEGGKKESGKKEAKAEETKPAAKKGTGSKEAQPQE